MRLSSGFGQLRPDFSHLTAQHARTGISSTTHTICRHVIPQKKLKIAAGEKFAIMAGKAKVSPAAQHQYVAEPSVWPLARMVGWNTSATNTEITTPCPSA